MDATNVEALTEILSEALLNVDQYHDNMDAKTILENEDDVILEDRKQHAAMVPFIYKEHERDENIQHGSNKQKAASQITFDRIEKQPRKTFGPCRFLDRHCINQAVYKKTRLCEKHYREANARKKCIKCRKKKRGFLESFCDECLQKNRCIIDSLQKTL